MHDLRDDTGSGGRLGTWLAARCRWRCTSPLLVGDAKSRKPWAAMNSQQADEGLHLQQNQKRQPSPISACQGWGGQAE